MKPIRSIVGKHVTFQSDDPKIKCVQNRCTFVHNLHMEWFVEEWASVCVWCRRANCENYIICRWFCVSLAVFFLASHHVDTTDENSLVQNRARMLSVCSYISQYLCKLFSKTKRFLANGNNSRIWASCRCHRLFFFILFLSLHLLSPPTLLHTSTQCKGCGKTQTKHTCCILSLCTTQQHVNDVIMVWRLFIAWAYLTL